MSIERRVSDTVSWVSWALAACRIQCSILRRVLYTMWKRYQKEKSKRYQENLTTDDGISCRRYSKWKLYGHIYKARTKMLFSLAATKYSCVIVNAIRQPLPCGLTPKPNLNDTKNTWSYFIHWLWCFWLLICICVVIIVIIVVMIRASIGRGRDR